MARMNLGRRLAIMTAVGTLAVAGIAQAHPRLLGTSPAANSAVQGVNRITLNFSERLVAPLSGGQLYMAAPGNRSILVGSVRTTLASNGMTLIFQTSRQLGRGHYHLDWHAVAADTHRVRGTFAFSVR